MKRTFVAVLCLAFANIAVAHSADPVFQTQTTAKQPQKTVTKQEFFKQFTELRQKANNQVWVLTFVPKQKDPHEIKYSGTNQNKDVETSILRLEPGDSVVITTDTKPAKHLMTYILK